VTHAALSRSRSVLTLGTLLFAACSGDGSTGPEVDLTTEEAAEVLEALTAVSSVFDLTLGADNLRTLSVKTAGSLGSMPALTEQLDESVPCPNGGTTRVRGALTVNESTGAATIDVRQSYAGCAVTTESNRTWTLNGDPDIRTIVSATETSFTASQRGAVIASSSGKSGRCAVDIAFSLTGSAVTVSGTVCGESVSETVGLDG
jgi:hypothetical protein